MTDTSANFPAGDPLDPQGRLTPQWRMFFMALFNRSGGTGKPIDISSLQNSVEAQASEIDDLFMHANSMAVAAQIGALAQRVAVLEMALQGLVTVAVSADNRLPEPVHVTRQDSTNDFLKMVN